MPHQHWLLLRGLGRESRHWNAFPQVLGETLGDATVHTLDLPGTGTEHRRSSPLTVAAIAEDVRRRWSHLSQAHPGRWGILGVSLGGMVAMEWAARHPLDFQQAVLVNSTAADLATPWERMRPRVLGELARAGRIQDPVERERIGLRVTTAMPLPLDEIATTWASWAREAPMRRRNVVRQLLAASAWRAPEAIPCPGLVLSGARDALADPEISMRIAARLRATHQQHPHGGHDLSLDDPHWVARAVAHWTSDLQRMRQP